MKIYLNIIKTLIVLIMLSFIILVSTDIKSEMIETDRMISVEIRGEVVNPGVYQIPSGSSYKDVFEMAILTEKADISDISLQTAVYNKQLIVIPEKKETSLISINSASLEELCTLPGIGEKTAMKIIEYRTNYSSFLTLEQLKEVSGIGDAKFNKIRQYICL